MSRTWRRMIMMFINSPLQNQIFNAAQPGVGRVLVLGSKSQLFVVNMVEALETKPWVHSQGSHQIESFNPKESWGDPSPGRPKSGV